MTMQRIGILLAAGFLAAGPALARGLSEGATKDSIQGTSLYLANTARRDEAKGDYKAAILIYDELLQRHPQDAFIAKRMALCEKALEASRGAGEASVAERPAKPSNDSEPSLPPDPPELGSKNLTPDLKQQ
jgi:hypothetical protein